MRIKEGHPLRDIRNIEHVPHYLGFLIPGGNDSRNPNFGAGPYIILRNMDLKKECQVLNCGTHILSKIPWGTKVIMIKIDLSWSYALLGENL